MASLPTVGGSNNTWGTELNAYLAVEHDATGYHNEFANDITFNGNVGVGTSSISRQMHIYTTDQTNGGCIRMELSYTTVLTDYVYGKLEFYGNDGSTGASGVRAQMQAISTGTQGECDLVFYTADSNTSMTENMRISHDGEILLNANNAFVADGNLSASQIAFWLDETGHDLYFKAKYSDGTTVKQGTIALT